MDKDTQLPAEVSAELSKFIKDKIEKEREYWNDNPSADSDRAKTYVAGYGKGVSTGATEYATLLHQANEDKELIRMAYECSQKERDELQAKCERLEKERHETRLALRMVLKAFKGGIKTERHKEWYAKAEAVFNKYHNVADVLRSSNEALSGEGEKDFRIDYKQRELERGRPAPEGAIKAMHERWRITGERKECTECGLWYIPAEGCPDCTTNQKVDKQ